MCIIVKTATFNSTSLLLCITIVSDICFHGCSPILWPLQAFSSKLEQMSTSTHKNKYTHLFVVSLHTQLLRSPFIEKYSCCAFYCRANSDSGATPLYAASLLGLTPLVQALVREGARLDTRISIAGVTPIHAAAWNGHTKIVSYLIEQKAKVDERSAEKV